VKRPLQSCANNLSKDAVEIVRHLRGEKRSIPLREFSARLEKVRHVQRSARAIPIQISHGVVSHGIENRLTTLAVLLEVGRSGRTVNHLRLVGEVAHERV